jgi:dipeptidyl aminopeptidase/acylaminoacyl peptidase
VLLCTRLPLTVALAAAFCSSAIAASPVSATALPAEHFFSNDTTQQMRLSPSGRWLGIESREQGGRARLTVIDLEGKEQPKIIAAFTRFDVANFRWVNDDWLVFSVYDENDHSGKSSGGGLATVRRDGEKMRSLIKRRFDSLFQEQGNVALEPNNEMLAVGAPGTNEIIIGEDHYDTDYKEYVHTSLRRMDVSTGATRAFFKDSPPPPAKIKSWLFDNRGEPRVAVASEAGVSRMFWADRSTKQWRKIAEYSTVQGSFVPAYVDEKDRLFVSALNPQTSFAELREFDFASGAPRAEAVISLPGFDTYARPIRDAGSNKVHGVRLLTDSQSVAWFSPAMADIQQKIDNALPGRVNMTVCAPCESPKTVLVHSYSDTAAGDYLMYRVAEGRLERLGSRRPDHRAAEMANVDLHRTKTRDGADLPVWITKTQGNSPRPAVVLVHGGPWTRGGEWRWDPDAQFLATRGYVVIEPEFRGSVGYGDAHFRAGWKQWGMRMQDDVADALRFAVDKGWVDPKRVCIAGASYGGYSTLMGLAKDKDLYKCGVAWVAVTDPRYMYTLHWSDISESSKQHSMPEMIGDLEKDAAMLAANAPIALASKIKAPLMLAYGGRDRRVPLYHGEKMRDALTSAGNAPEWVVYDNEGHGWFRTANSIDFWKRTEAFLAKHLK